MGNFNMLPPEISLEILSRLPAESVLECKLVSKPWRYAVQYAVQHPSFSQMHLKHLDSAAQDTGKLSFIFFQEEEFCFTYTEYNEDLNCLSRRARISIRPPYETHEHIGSCNGLICYSASLHERPRQHEPAYICNPVTRECVVLPELGNYHLVYGFGYIPSTNEYKVVRICNCRRDPSFGIVQIYTLGSGIGWRSGVKKMNYDVNVSFQISRCGVFANGAIHWVTRSGLIIGFNLADEEFQELPTPPTIMQRGVFPYDLNALGDCLCAYDYCCGPSGKDIWVFKKDQNSQGVYIWSKEYSEIEWHDIPFSIIKSGGLLCWDYCDKNVYHYAPEGSSSRKLVNFCKNAGCGAPHRNTFVSLKALGEEDTKLMDLGERERSCGDKKQLS